MQSVIPSASLQAGRASLFCEEGTGQDCRAVCDAGEKGWLFSFEVEIHHYHYHASCAAGEAKGSLFSFVGETDPHYRYRAFYGVGEKGKFLLASEAVTGRGLGYHVSCAVEEKESSSSVLVVTDQGCRA